MAMTYEETNALAHDGTFRGRVAVACVHFANYITGELPSTPAHSTRIKWAQQTMLTPEIAVNQCIATVVNDTAVQAAGGAAITDDALQEAVETSINKLL
jgi:hypothetical protein